MEAALNAVVVKCGNVAHNRHTRTNRKRGDWSAYHAGAVLAGGLQREVAAATYISAVRCLAVDLLDTCCDLGHDRNGRLNDERRSKSIDVTARHL